MSKIWARINPATGSIELVDEGSRLIAENATLSATDAACLARGVLACAAMLALQGRPSHAVIGGDAHFPILKWVVTSSTATGKPVVIFSIPAEIELTFQMSPQLEKELGVALVSHSQGSKTPDGHYGAVH
jgi:hypothetical protein